MKRVAIAGFQHETNTFGATKAGMAEFEMADSWPPLLRGEQAISGTEASQLPLAGFVRRARQDPEITLVPILWCSAEPSAHVTDDAFEQTCSEILGGLAAADPLDGLYLDLHGAMVTESQEDGEGELLARIRAAVGPDLPIVASLDLHANVTARMMEHATAFTVFRTYPHLDMAETGARACDVLCQAMNGMTIYKALRKVPFLIPLQAQNTWAAPCDALYALESECEAGWSEIALGFPAADIADVGPAVLAFASTEEQANAAADRVFHAIMESEAVFDCSLVAPNAAVSRALLLTEDRRLPVVLADVQDNPGAGAASDTTGLLAALVEGGATGAILGMLNDPEVAALAHAAGVGAKFDAALGGKGGPNAEPYRGRFKVEALSDGRFAFTGQMYAGSVADTGPSACLRIVSETSDVRVVISSKRCQCLDQAIFTHIGVDPKDARVIAVKSTVHHRADFEPISQEVINVAAPGLFPCRLDKIDYRNLRPGVRKMPRQ